MQDLGTLPGGDLSQAQAINQGGQVVGYSTSASGPHAFVWTRSSGMQDIGVLPGDQESRALRVNDSGSVVGWSSGSGGTRAFLWSNNTGIQEVEGLADSTFSVAFDINNSGQVVGTSNTSLGPRAFVWSESTGAKDLNSLIPANSGLVLVSAISINDRWQIVATGTVNADTGHFVDLDDPHHAALHTHVFLLTPQ
jgi:probable HAF family extracellular repeat protein